jgi:hypothetical protein
MISVDLEHNVAALSEASGLGGCYAIVSKGRAGIDHID